MSENKIDSSEEEVRYWPVIQTSAGRHERLISECERVEAECTGAIGHLAETRERAVRLKHRLQRLSMAESARNDPAAFLGSLRGYATAQRVSVAARGLTKPGPY